MAESILKLRVDSNEYESKIKRASQGLLQMEQACRSVGGTLAVLEKEDKAFVASLGKMETVSKTARGSLGELTAAFTDLSMQYKRLTDEEKKGDFGTALKHSLDELKGRIQDTKKDLADIDKELNGATQATGDFSGVLGQLGSKLGINADLMGLVTTGTMGYVAAAGAAITATIAATKAWADYNAELSKQMQITTVTTGLSGGDANKLRDAADAMAKVYGVDFREVINAANILMTQFGQTSDRSIQLLRDGMQGMIAGDGPKMLNMIQQFAPAFRDAGISADQLVAIIHNSEGGLFSEQNMNAILMGIKNIRLMTKSTSDALAQLGLDGEEMSKRMSDGSMTVFDALEQVATAIEGAKSGSQDAGQVMQQVFGRQGAMQGMKLGRAIAELNTNLEQTKKQTGELGKSFAALETANERLNESIRNATGWDEMEQKIKNVEAVFVSAVAMAVGAIGDVRNSLYDLTGIDVFDKLASSALLALGPVGTLLDDLRQIAGINITPPDDSTKYNRNDFKNPIGGVIGRVAPTSTYEDRPKPGAEDNQQTIMLNKERRAAEENAEAIKKLNERLETLKKLRAEAKDTQTRTYYAQQIADVQNQINSKKGVTTSKTTPKVDTDKEVTIQQQIAALEKEAFTASEERRKEIASTIQELDKELARQQQIRDALHGTVKDSKELQEAEKQYADAVAKVASWQKPTQTGMGNYISEVQKSLNGAELGSIDYQHLYANMADANAFKNLMQVAIQQGLDDVVVDASPLWQQIISMDDVPDSTWQDIVDTINQKLKDAGIDKVLTLDVNTGKTSEGKNQASAATKQNETVVGLTQKMTSGIGSMVSGIEGLGVEIPKGLNDILNGIQGVTTILTGISAILSVIETITAADAAIPFFAQGGVVKAAGGWSGKIPGNHMSGDAVHVLANSGETILTAAQAGNLNTMLQDANRGGGEAQPYVTGEKIWLGVNNFLRRSGRGEIVTSRR